MLQFQVPFQAALTPRLLDHYFTFFLSLNAVISVLNVVNLVMEVFF